MNQVISEEFSAFGLPSSIRLFCAFFRPGEKKITTFLAVSTDQNTQNSRKPGLPSYRFCQLMKDHYTKCYKRTFAKDNAHISSVSTLVSDQYFSLILWVGCERERKAVSDKGW